ncbi:hypothetical protein KXD40_004407 [Peronospora effusa]|nr:hypothetical protein KXD40_004407 [Peronospora effusa]
MYEYEMLSFLAGQYKPVDLIRALVAGTKVPKEAQLATRVLKCQVREWVRNESSEKEVFELLQIHQGEGDPFQRPLFFVWVNFVKLKYEKSLEEAEMKMFIFLEDYCKGDDLAKVLVAATKVDSTKLLAEQRLNSQIDVWVEERRDAASVFKLLELHQKSDNLFASPLFFTWVTFVRSRFSDDLEATKAMISTLRGVYEGEGDLVRVLAEGAKIERMKAVAETLQKALNEGSPKVLKRHDNDANFRSHVDQLSAFGGRDGRDTLSALHSYTSKWGKLTSTGLRGGADKAQGSSRSRCAIR